MFSKKNKDQKASADSGTQQQSRTHTTRQISVQSSTSYTHTQTTHQRHSSFSYSENASAALPSGSQLSLPGLSMTNYLSSSPPRTADFSRPRSSIVTDARPVTVNLNYQSPYRHSPVYKSYSTSRGVSSSTSKPAFPSPQTKIIQPKISISPPNDNKIAVKKTGKVYDNNQDQIPTYKTSSKNRGEVLIINNVMFEGKQERLGAKKDEKKLVEVFTQIGFKVTKKRDLSRKQMQSAIENFSKQSSLKSADICVVVVMSHGTKNQQLGGTEVFGLDEKGLLVEDILQYFTADKCTAMQGKPKIFIFQCCRGDDKQFLSNDAKPIKTQVRPIADMLIAYSTLPGFVSIRDPEQGTWYIQTVCDVFSQHAHEYHVEDMLKIVDVKLSQFQSRLGQTTTYESRGFKRCYLHPK